MFILIIFLLGFGNNLIIIALIVFLSLIPILGIHSVNHHEHNHIVENNEPPLPSFEDHSYPGDGIGIEFLYQ